MATVTRYVETAAENGAQVISLPEMWNCPYSTIISEVRRSGRRPYGSSCRIWLQSMTYISLADRSRNWMETRCTTHRFLLIAAVRSSGNITEVACSISM